MWGEVGWGDGGGGVGDGEQTMNWNVIYESCFSFPTRSQFRNLLYKHIF